MNDLITFLARTATASAVQTPESIIFSIAEYGVLGIAVIALGYAYWRKSRQVDELYDRLIANAETQRDKVHELGESVNDTLKELTTAIIEALE